MINYLPHMLLYVISGIGQFENRYYCTNKHCGRNYKNKCSLTYHINNECGVNPKFKCQFCSKTSSRYSNLKRHMISVHKYIDDSPNAPNATFVFEQN